MSREEDKEKTLWDEIEQCLQHHNRTWADVACVKLADSQDRMRAVPLGNFEKMAKKKILGTVWMTYIPYPMLILGRSGDWWIESTEYDSRTGLWFRERPLPEDPTHIIVGQEDDNDNMKFSLADISELKKELL